MTDFTIGDKVTVCSSYDANVYRTVERCGESGVVTGGYKDDGYTYIEVEFDDGEFVDFDSDLLEEKEES